MKEGYLILAALPSEKKARELTPLEKGVFIRIKNLDHLSHRTENQLRRRFLLLLGLGLLVPGRNGDVYSPCSLDEIMSVMSNDMQKEST